MSKKPSIAVLGAGMGGLTVAAALHRRGSAGAAATQVGSLVSSGS